MMIRVGAVTSDFSDHVDNVTCGRSRLLVSHSAFLAGGLVQWLTKGSAAVYAIPVVLATTLLGWSGGLAVTVLSSVGMYWISTDQAKLSESHVLLFLACLNRRSRTGRERRLRHHFQQVARQLSGVYEKVQANFEGMKRAERLSALGQLSAGLAHEIRHPLASISGAASILARTENLDPKSSKCLEIIRSECERLNGLLTNFLNFARPRREEIPETGAALLS